MEANALAATTVLDTIGVPAGPTCDDPANGSERAATGRLDLMGRSASRRDGGHGIDGEPDRPRDVDRRGVDGHVTG